MFVANERVIQFARVDFRRDRRMFGIKNEDRFSHVYIIGKTGTGKSTLIETMALQDLELGNGFALVDPHGDLADRVASLAFPHHASRTSYTSIPPTRPNRTGTIRSGRCEVISFHWQPPA